MMFTPAVGSGAWAGLCAGLLSVIKVVEAGQMRGSHHPESWRSVQDRQLELTILIIHRVVTRTRYIHQPSRGSQSRHQCTYCTCASS